jgi:hypothetical protein
MCCGFCIKQRDFLYFFPVGHSCPHCAAAIKLDVDRVGFAKSQHQ